VRFGREVDDGIDFGNQRRDGRRVRDVADDEAKARGLLGSASAGSQIDPVAGVGQLVEDGDGSTVAAGEHVPYEAGPNETGSACHEQTAESRLYRVAHVPGLVGGAIRWPERDSCSASSAARIRE